MRLEHASMAAFAASNAASERSSKAGAKPAAKQQRVLIPKRDLRRSARRAIISRLGCALPVSRQERCLVELWAAKARSA